MSKRSKNHHHHHGAADEDELYDHQQPEFIVPPPTHANYNVDRLRNSADHGKPVAARPMNETSALSSSSSGEPARLPHQQLRVIQAAAIICGEVSGVGVLSMPAALANTGWFGIILLVVIGIASCYTGNLLAKCWMILQQNYPEYASHCRLPYPSIAQQSLGRAGRITSSIFINLTLFGGGVVFIVLAAQNTQEFLYEVWGVDKSLCMYIVIWGLIYMPVTWLGSPKDFWQLGLGAWMATITVLIMVLVTVLVDHARNPDAHKRVEDPVTFQSFFFGFGTFMFAFGVHPSLPNIHHDMRKSSDFKKSLIVAFAVTTIQYIPVPIVCYALYGRVESNILLTIPKGPVQYVALVLITCHVVLAVNAVLNTVYQEIEHLAGVPHGFNIQRILVRGAMMLFAMFVALSIPHFGVLLDLVGGFCITVTTFVLPPMCYYILMQKWSTVPIPAWEKGLMGLIILLGIFGTVVSTYSGIYELVTSPAFTAPCYTAAWSNYGANGTKTG